MATTYTANALAAGVLITEEINGETDFNFTFPDLSGNLTSGSVSYFTFESLRNPLTQTFSASIAYAKGEKEVGVNSKIQIKPNTKNLKFTLNNQNISVNNITTNGNLVITVGSILYDNNNSKFDTTDDFIWSANLQDGGADANNVVVWTPDVAVPVGGAKLYANGGIILEVD